MRGRTDAPLSSLTRLEAERESKLRSEEEKEKLAVLGQDSELKAAPWVRKEANEQERLAKEDWNQDMQILSKLKNGKPKYYFRYLAGILMKFAQEEEIPKKYRVNVDLTDQGLVVKIVGTKYQGAFKPAGLPSFDRNACKVLAVRLGNTIAKLEGYVHSTEAGVLIPDEEDTKKYGRNNRL